MLDQHLATYLNDHLDGSVTALELLEDLEKTHTGTTATGRFAAEPKADILADRQELEALMARLHAEVRSPRKAAMWLAEKVTEAVMGAVKFDRFFPVAAGLDVDKADLLWRTP